MWKYSNKNMDYSEKLYQTYQFIILNFTSWFSLIHIYRAKWLRSTECYHIPQLPFTMLKIQHAPWNFAFKIMTALKLTPNLINKKESNVKLKDVKMGDFFGKAF